MRRARAAGFAAERAIALDVRDGAAVAACLRDFPRLDILINCAGIIRRAAEHDPAVFAEVVDVNLTGTMRLAAAARPLLAKSAGCIVNTASMYSFFGGPHAPGYAASKGGVAQLTKSLAVAYAPEGIRVNAVAPGWIAHGDDAAGPRRPAQEARRSSRARRSDAGASPTRSRRSRYSCARRPRPSSPASSCRSMAAIWWHEYHGGHKHPSREDPPATRFASLHTRGADRRRKGDGHAARHRDSTPEKGRMGQGARDRAAGRDQARLLGARHRAHRRGRSRQRALLVSPRGQAVSQGSRCR